MNQIKQIQESAKVGEAQPYDCDLSQSIALNHIYNGLLWEEEDLARRQFVPAEEIVDNKRNIDKYNQLRNDHIEKIDELILKQLFSVTLTADSEQNSETPGSIVDRLSIISLKINAMRQESVRENASTEHRAQAFSRLKILLCQRDDLFQCLDRLLRQFASGVRYFRVYRQYKMYNDPTLNPKVREEKDFVSKVR